MSGSHSEAETPVSFTYIYIFRLLVGIHSDVIKCAWRWVHWGFQATWLPLRALYALLLRTGDVKEMAVEGLGFDSWLKKVFFPFFGRVCFCFVLFFLYRIFLPVGWFQFNYIQAPSQLNKLFFGKCISSNIIFFTGINLYIPSAAQAGQQQKLSLTLEEWQL